MNATPTVPMNASVSTCLNPDCVRSAVYTARRRLVRPSWRAIGLSVAISIVAHLSALAALVPGDSDQIAGGAPATLAALGNSFADFTQGSTPAQPATAAPSPVDPPLTPEATRDTAPSVQPPAATQTPPSETLVMLPPAVTGLTAPEAADPVVPLAIDPEAPQPGAIAPSPSTATPAAPVPPQVTEFTRTEPAPTAPATPRTPVAPAAPSAAPEPLAPAPEVTVQQADNATPRPQRRPEPQTQAQAQPRQEPVQRERPRTPQASAPQVAGNAEQDARRGSADGAAGADATASGTSGAASQAGNAAVSNYPGQVMERIRRTRQQRVSGRGVAVVSFSIGNNGGLAAASIQRSSGSPAIDAAALAHIQRAAPFPAPPAGAGRSFSFEFVVR